MTQTRRLIVILVAAVALSTAALGYLYFNQQVANSAAGGVAIGGPIRLTDQNGTAFDSASLSGKPYIVFFGFTHCPEACPTTLSEISRVTDDLGAEAKPLTTLFITIDPDRDTPAVMKDYVSNFTAHVIGLSGTPQQIADVAKEYRVYYKKVPTSDGSYTMDHTAVVYLMDRKGQFQGILNYTEEHDRYVEKIKQLLTD
jgi:protein SCO1/2